MKIEAKQELEQIRNKFGGILQPRDVVEFARDPETALHSYFEWDNSIAAEQYRLAQARAVIRVAVIVNEASSERVRAYVSLKDDRYETGGYRAIIDVMDDESLKQAMFDDAVKELESFKKRYEKIESMSLVTPIFTAIDNLIVFKEDYHGAAA